MSIFSSIFSSLKSKIFIGIVILVLSLLVWLLVTPSSQKVNTLLTPSPSLVTQSALPSPTISQQPVNKLLVKRDVRLPPGFPTLPKVDNRSNKDIAALIQSSDALIAKTNATIKQLPFALIPTSTNINQPPSDIQIQAKIKQLQNRLNQLKRQTP